MPDGASFATTTAFEMPNFVQGADETTSEFMLRVQEESLEFQLQMVAYNSANAAENKAIETLDKVADRQAN